MKRIKSALLQSSYVQSEIASVRANLKAELKAELEAELHAELKAALKTEIKPEVHAELKVELAQAIQRLVQLPGTVRDFCADISVRRAKGTLNSEVDALELRRLVRTCAGLTPDLPGVVETADLLAEFRFLHASTSTLRPAFEAVAAPRVLFCGQAYYNSWYLSRGLRKLGWQADVYNWDTNPSSQIYYHGEDFRLGGDIAHTLNGELGFYLAALYRYDVVHFANTHCIAFGWSVQSAATSEAGEGAEIYLLKNLGKKIVYSNNGCLDGVSQTSFSKWGPESVCAICPWQSEKTVCNDERNLKWGKFRNSVANFQCTLGGNRVDYNDDPRVHEVPEFYCLDSEIWKPDLDRPPHYRRPDFQGEGVRLYHAIGNREERTRLDGVNIKSTHVYMPIIERLRSEGLLIDLIEPTGVPNIEVRFLQAQADIFLEMLTYGWFGANAREAMMLGKPVICFIRPEWLESLREEIPEYANELPIVSATPETVEGILRDLISHPEKRLEIGRRSREFALKWHTSEAAGKRFDQIYRALLAGEPLLRPGFNSR
ncbi:MAG TPA: glycosyltransferase [Polaromonas sp.]|uniref:glycosyltransferase n=1 Tax=Polaromonas sp. TaxID=1869339 RepID=UPI002D459CF9|nr:glycosyltransferase [Polaromonas sp.]HYW56847.1 glycosyltransferase [Polaromonas sp.]